MQRPSRYAGPGPQPWWEREGNALVTPGGDALRGVWETVQHYGDTTVDGAL